MNIEDIKAFIAEHAEEPEVKSFLDSAADKRVNQARQKWEADIPARLDEEIKIRQQRAAEIEKITEEARRVFQERNIPAELGLKLLGDVSELSEEDRAARIEEVSATVLPELDSFLKSRYKSNPPTAGLTPASEEQAFRDELKTRMKR